MFKLFRPKRKVSESELEVRFISEYSATRHFSFLALLRGTDFYVCVDQHAYSSLLHSVINSSTNTSAKLFLMKSS